MATRAIELQQVSKRYKLGRRPGQYETLRGAIAGVFRRPSRSRPGELWALRDVAISVDEGQAVGVIGPNGAGKTRRTG
jgi:ABC-type polysaccharide/polyol phosphate transport system ATPase subunit